MAMQKWDAEVLFNIGAETAEGPLWDPRTNQLLFVDIPSKRLYRTALGEDSPKSTLFDHAISAVALREAGGYVLATEKGFAFLADDEVSPMGSLELRADLRMNDGAVDPAGDFWAGSISIDFRKGAGALWRLSRDGSITKELSGVTVSNGIDWSVDGNIMYYIDSDTSRVDIFDYDIDQGRVANRRPFVTIRNGLPDGICTDGENCVWVAAFGGGGVHRFDPSGRHIGTVDVPAWKVTSCAFVGPDLDILAITSSGKGLSHERRRAENAGDVFWVSPGVSGRPAGQFLG